jgi:hypothetical protein
LAFSTAIRKARDLGRRSLALALSTGRPLNPRARYAPRPPDCVLVLQKGENATTGYYLRPRIERMQLPAAFADLDGDPAACELLGEAGGQSILVVVCRYASARWLERLDRLRPRIARMAYFVDDDLLAMMRDPDLRPPARRHWSSITGPTAIRRSAPSSSTSPAVCAISAYPPRSRSPGTKGSVAPAPTCPI